MDWKKIEQETGYKILFASLCGSRSFKINREDSDYDYVAYILLKDGQVAPSRRANHFPGAGVGDVFFQVLSPNIALWAHTWVIASYDNIVYADERFTKFLEANKRELVNICPHSTLKTCRDFVSKRCHTNNIKIIALAVREAAILHNFMQKGDFNQSVYLDGEYLSMYNRIRIKREKVEKIEILRLLSWIDSEETFQFFQSFPTNHELFERLCKMLEEIQRAI